MSMTRTRPSANGSGPELLDRVGTATVRHRNWPRVGAAAALAIVCGAVFILLYSSAGSRHPVLAVAQPIPAGQQLVASDFTTVGVTSNPGLNPVPAGDLSIVVARRAAIALMPGTLLTPSDLTTAPSVAKGSTTVGLDLKPGQVPGDLTPGASVMIVATANSASVGTSTSSGPTVLVKKARVLVVSAPSASTGSGDTGLTVVVPTSDAAAVLNAASAGTVAVAAVGPIGGS